MAETNSGIAAKISRVGTGIIRRLLPAVVYNYLGTLVSVNTATKVAAITFDDGPDPIWTPKILDALDEFNAKATFFVIGRRVKNNPHIVKRAHDSGHSIANHTWDHPCLSILSRKERFAQIENCKNSIAGYDSNLFRPPYGCQSLGSRLDAFLCGYSVVAWDVHAADWEDRQAEEIARDLNSRLRPGTIILLHDAQDGRSREEMLKGLTSFLESNSDYRFVTVPELQTYGEKKEMIWTKKPNEGDLKSHRLRYDTIDI